MWFFVPPEDFFAYIQNPANHTVLIGFVIGIAGFLVYDVIWLKEDFCIYICPYSRVQSVLYDEDTYQAIYIKNRGGKIYDENHNKLVFKQKDVPEGGECTACESCVKVCPTHIDIRKGMQLECINCLECVDACTVVMGKLNKPSLIQWTSTKEAENKGKTKFFRKRTYIYLVALFAVVTMLFIMGGKKEYMLLNINKTTQLYKVVSDNNGKKYVVNNFLMLFQNTQDKDYTYDLEIADPQYKDKIKIRRFSAFKLGAGKKRKKVVQLITYDLLVDNPRKDTPITVTIRAFAKEDPKKISVIRHAVFVFPRSDKLK